MNAKQIDRIVEHRRAELLHRRAQAMTDAINATLALRTAAQAVRVADRQLVVEGFDVPLVTVDDASDGLYGANIARRIRAWPGAMAILAEALQETDQQEITVGRVARDREE